MVSKAFISGTHTVKQKLYNEVIKEINDDLNLFLVPNNNIDINLNKKIHIKAKSNITKNKFFNNVEKAKKFIRDGDIFQIVPSHRFEMDFKLPAAELYRVLRETNPSPFMYLFNFPTFNIVGSSPEILVRVRDKKVTIRPIAGTRPRGRNKKEDIKALVSYRRC